MKKKILTFALALVLCLSATFLLAGCGETEKDSLTASATAFNYAVQVEDPKDYDEYLGTVFQGVQISYTKAGAEQIDYDWTAFRNAGGVVIGFNCRINATQTAHFYLNGVYSQDIILTPLS